MTDDTPVFQMTGFFVMVSWCRISIWHVLVTCAQVLLNFVTGFPFIILFTTRHLCALPPPVCRVSFYNMIHHMCIVKGYLQLGFPFLTWFTTCALCRVAYGYRVSLYNMIHHMFRVAWAFYGVSFFIAWFTTCAGLPTGFPFISWFPTCAGLPEPWWRSPVPPGQVLPGPGENQPSGL
jgi:hypothetical protein